jgi:hypothetical protein
MANRASTRTTQLYDCRREEPSLDEVRGTGCDARSYRDYNGTTSEAVSIQRMITR